MVQPHLSEFEPVDMDELTRLIGDSVERPTEEVNELEKYAKLAIKLARKKEWALVRDYLLFEIDLHEPNKVIEGLVKNGAPKDVVGETMLISHQVRQHLIRVLGNVEGLVEEGKRLQTGQK